MWQIQVTILLEVMKALIHIMCSTNIIIMQIKVISHHSYLTNWDKDDDGIVNWP